MIILDDNAESVVLLPKQFNEILKVSINHKGGYVQSSYQILSQGGGVWVESRKGLNIISIYFNFPIKCKVIIITTFPKSAVNWIYITKGEM